MTRIPSTRLARCGLTVTRLAFGGAPIGNLYQAIGDDDAAATVDAAWDAGVRFFDTAPHYGLGLSERRLGAALARRPRDEYVLSTKVGRLLEPVGGSPTGRDAQGFDVPATHRRVWDFSHDGILRSVEASLRRLGTDRVDILFLHDPDDHWRQAIDHGYPALERLRAEGVVHAIGAGMNQAAMLTDFVRHTDMDLIMVAGRYTLLEQPALDALLPACLDRGVHVVAAGVFNSGLLAQERPAEAATYNYAPAPAHVVGRARRLADVCERHGTTLPAAALQFPLAHPAVASVAIGCASVAQIRHNVGLARAAVPPALWHDLRREGLLADAAPVPRAAPMDS